MSGGDGNGRRVLVIDDVAAIRESLRISLEAAGYGVEEAADGEAGLAQLAKSGFDAVVTDLWMPGVDGIDLLKRVRRERPELRVIVISGGGPAMPLDLSATLAQVWGADAVLYKPFDNSTLVARLDGLLGRSGYP